MRNKLLALRLSAVGLLTAALSVTLALAQQRPTIAPAPAFSSAELASLPRTAWPTNGGNLLNQRYSPLTQIDKANVAALKGVWRTHLNGSGLASQYSGEAQPLVYDGVVYVSTGADDVFALDVETGDILWAYEAGLDPDITTVCCSWANRGVALGDGQVFVGQLDGKLVALDQRTGRIVWSVQAARWQDGLTITSAPLYYGGMVITGFAGGEFGVRGRVAAFDAEDGSLRWTFYTIPGPGEPGHETWPQDNEVWKHGGATVWQTPAVDPELGLLYFSTGNPGPDFNGAVRPGDNLFTDSIVALDVETGEYRWHYQQVHHDLWDYDSTNPVVLFDAEIEGRMRKGIAEVSKTGWVYILDRTNGEPLIGIDERAVAQEPAQATSATQPHPRGDAVVPQSVDIAPEGFELVNGGRIFTPFTGQEGVIAAPSLYGGANWPPSAYDPVRRQLFVCASDFPGHFTAEENPEYEPPREGEYYEGSVVAFAPLPRMGIYAAMDVTTNEIVWRKRWAEQCYSGSVATAGGIVFVGRNDGRLTAVDSDTGNPLWEFQTGAGLHAPATVFEYGGREYVVALSAGNQLIGSDHGDRVWLFGLDGTLDETTPGDTIGGPAAGTASTTELGAPDLAAGAGTYRQACLPCHGEDGRGGHGGGAPLTGLADLAAVVQTVTDGRNDMPAFGAALSATQIRDVSVYVVEELR